jgi:hypothetical protein
MENLLFCPCASTASRRTSQGVGYCGGKKQHLVYITWYSIIASHSLLSCFPARLLASASLLSAVTAGKVSEILHQEHLPHARSYVHTYSEHMHYC